MNLLAVFAHHRVAANLLMLLMIMAGVYGLNKLNIQFFPSFEPDIVSVRVIWTGASSEDIERGITIPLEQALKSVDNLRKMTSTSAQGVSSIQLEFEEDSNLILALDKVKQKVNEFRNLPLDAEKPIVQTLVHYENIANVQLRGAADTQELRALVDTFEQDLMRRGIDKIDLNGLPNEEIAIEISTRQLQQLQMSLEQVANRIDTFSQDLPAGTFAYQDSSKELRTLDQRREELAFAQIPVMSDDTNYIELGEIAQIEKREKQGGVLRSVAGQQVAEMNLKRAETANAFESAEILYEWLQEIRPTLPPNITLTVYDESWKLIKERTVLLLVNGGGGLILVVLILYLFLNGRVAFWVAVGIPVSFMATLGVLYALGGSINMISLFGLIMALGIIVDDAIVVGEDALAHYQEGEEPLMAAEGGARRMFLPVIASSLTTIAAFLPLMMIGGIMGDILFDIPFVIICVIIASLIESFFILPGHLRHAFLHVKRDSDDRTSFRARLDAAFESFREQRFKKMIALSLKYRSVTITGAISILIISFALIAAGRIGYSFFPSPESHVVYANVSFVSGTSKQTTDNYLRYMEEKLNETNEELGGNLISNATTIHGSSFSGGNAGKQGDQLGAIYLQLIDPDKRSVRNETFIKTWKDKLKQPGGMDNLTITSRKTGPQGSDITVRLTGSSSDVLKKAATELSQALKNIKGVYGVDNDMPFGKEQLIFSLTAAGQAMGLTIAEIGKQLRYAFDGKLLQIYQDGANEVEVRVLLAKQERDRLSSLESFYIRAPDGEFVPLTTVTTWRARHGFEVLRHADGELAIEVLAEVDNQINKTNIIVDNLEVSVLPEIVSKFGVDYSFEGRSADEKDTFRDMKYGLFIGLALIYIVLAWVFSSYGWPLVVMSIIPFGLVGAIWGHWVMSIDMTLLSIFGFFGLSGIVVNDSIILVTFYKRLLGTGMSVTDALVEASAKRLRAVLLTSLTTIAGLTPLLFETSLQAQFLIPMATSIAFGLIFATVIVLFIVPVLLSYYDSIACFLNQREQNTELTPTLSLSKEKL